MRGAYYNGFADDADIETQFDTTLPDEVEILFAAYGGASYEGDATVIFRLNGKLFEVHGSHCSCYGLEGQWEPEETTVEMLKKYAADVENYLDPGEYESTDRIEFVRIVSEL